MFLTSNNVYYSDMKKTYLLPLFFLICFILFISQAKADWINLTGAETAPNIAEIYVLEDHVRIQLEVYVGDLEYFEELIPDSWMQEPDTVRPSLEDRMQEFSRKTLKILNENGTPLDAQLALVEPRMRVDRQSPFAGMINPMTRQRVPEAPADKRVLYAEIIYPFSEKPASLTFVPPLDDEGRATTTIGFIAYHKSVPVIDFRYLGAPARLDLDWDDPWYSKFDNPNLKRHHKSALMSFLYVEPYELRHEILIRVKDLESWMDLGLRGDEYIEVDELDGLRQRIGEFLRTKNQVLIDGKAYKPILDRTNYVQVGIKGIQLLEQPERLEVSTAIVGVILAYITEGLPQQVTVDWELFNEQIQRVPATSTDPAGPLPTFLTPDDNVHVWNNYLKNYTPPTVAQIDYRDTVKSLEIPWASLISVLVVIILLVLVYRRHRVGEKALGLISIILGLVILMFILYPVLRVEVARPELMVRNLDEQESKVILDSMLKNIYRAFDFREESDVYDKLALSVEGDLLSTIYLQNRKSFAVKKAGGAQARVKEVEVLEVSSEPVNGEANTFQLNANWTALGTVGHWGHVHTRKNDYDARVTIRIIDGSWKMTGLELVEERRIDPVTNKPLSE
jgi:hypothetical protein